VILAVRGKIIRSGEQFSIKADPDLQTVLLDLFLPDTPFAEGLLRIADNLLIARAIS
jgi:hypothetical protein